MFKKLLLDILEGETEMPLEALIIIARASGYKKFVWTWIREIPEWYDYLLVLTLGRLDTRKLSWKKAVWMIYHARLERFGNAQIDDRFFGALLEAGMPHGKAFIKALAAEIRELPKGEEIATKITRQAWRRREIETGFVKTSDGHGKALYLAVYEEIQELLGRNNTSLEELIQDIMNK